MKISKHYSVLIFILLAFILAACSQPGGLDLPTEGGEVFTLVNQYRVSKGLEPLEWNNDVYLFAQVHADDMAAAGGLSHTDSNGVSFVDRINASGFAYTTASENIAEGYATADEVVAAWIASIPHLANIENPAFTKTGVGFNSNGNYWCQVFIGD